MENNHPHHEEHMEDNHPHHEGEECCGGYNKGECCGGNRIGKCCKSRTIRVIIKVAIILIIIAVVAGLIRRFDRHERFNRGMASGGYYGMMDVNTAPGGATQPGFGMMRFGRMGYSNEKSGEEKNGASRLFGVIKSINGNQITVTDNGAKDQTFASDADTTIVSSAGEIGLSALKAGQNVILTQTKGADGKAKLQFIQVL
jgi:hypothetical protein